MNESIAEMLKNYTVNTNLDRKNTIKEIVQEIVLCGLSRAGFFKEAAFYGGTALRIFYGLDRFSEDLDFSLMEKNPRFKLSNYIPVLEKEIQSFGINFKITEKEKNKESNIRSAFLKGNTREHLLDFYSSSAEANTVSGSEMIRIKLEIDIDPPDFATFERKYRLLPAPYEVNLYALPSLFSGKIHSVLCRKWQQRVKGRDLYDYVFYLSKKASYNHDHLCARLYDSGCYEEKSPDLAVIKQLLNDRFDQIDYLAACKDVEPFVKDPTVLNIWNADFFKSITESLTHE